MFMPVPRWKVLDGAGFRLHYLSTFDPVTLLESLGQTPRFIGGEPEVKLYSMGRRSIAVRHFPGSEDPHFRPANVLFNQLKRMVDERDSIVETPYFFMHPLDNPREGMIGTQWKPLHRMLGKHLDDLAVTPQQKMKSAERMIRLLARLHARGTLHGHHNRSVVGNAGVDARGNVHLVDYSLLRGTEESPTDSSEEETHSTIRDLSCRIYLSHRSLPEFPDRNSLDEHFWKKYDGWLQHYGQRRA